MGIRDMIDKFRDRNSEFKELEAQDRAMEKIRLRKMSSNERELERFQKEEREENIKNALSKIRETKKKDFFHNDTITQKNIFNTQKRLFSLK